MVVTPRCENRVAKSCYRVQFGTTYDKATWLDGIQSLLCVPPSLPLEWPPRAKPPSHDVKSYGEWAKPITPRCTDRFVVQQCSTWFRMLDRPCGVLPSWIAPIYILGISATWCYNITLCVCLLCLHQVGQPAFHISLQSKGTDHSSHGTKF